MAAVHRGCGSLPFGSIRESETILHTVYFCEETDTNPLYANVSTYMQSINTGLYSERKMLVI